MVFGTEPNYPIWGISNLAANQDGSTMVFGTPDEEEEK